MAKVSADPFGGAFSSVEDVTVDTPRIPNEKIVTGKVVQKKKSLGQRFSDIFIADSMDLKTYFVSEVAIPGIKNAFMYCLDGIQGALEMKLFGTSTRRRSGYFSNTPYNTISTGYGKVTFGGQTQQAQPITRGQNSMDLGTIVLESKGEADLVLDRLLDRIDQFGSTTVADLYELVGVTENFTDRYFGWKNLSRAEVRRVRGGGYALVLPPPISLK